MTIQYDFASVSARIVDHLLRRDHRDETSRLIRRLHPADRAALYASLNRHAQGLFLSLLNSREFASMLPHLDDETRGSLIRQTPRFTLTRALDHLKGDEAVDVLRSMPAKEARMVLAGMRTRDKVAPLLAYSPDTAGGLMTRGFVPLDPEMTAAQAVNHLRLLSPTPDEVYYLYVLDSEDRLLGVVSLRALIAAPPKSHVARLMTSPPISVVDGTDQEECAALMRRYRLMTLPVLSDDGKLAGIITADDLVDVLAEEATEDMYKMAGVGVKERALSPLGESLRRRMPHLVTNLVTAFLSGLTVSAFEGTISKAASLAVFMPIIAGHGGNTGTQVATIVVRSVALDELKKKDTLKLLAKEIGFGLIHGCLVGALTAALALALYQNPWLAGVVFFSMVGNVVIAGIVGSLTPLALQALKMDPALASAIYLTTFTDVIGFLMLLGAGTLFVTHLT